MLKRGFVYISVLLFSTSAFPQPGGRGVYEFLNLPSSPRLSALGGKMLAVFDNDLSLTFYNPSLLNSSMEQQLALNFASYFAGINFGYAAYAPRGHRLGSFTGGIHFINYGKFDESDETGTLTGHFRASEYALNLGWSRAIDSSFHFGINLKPVFSVFERYTSSGLAVDLGLSYHDRESLFAASFVVRNLGVQFTGYHSGTRESLPAELQLAVSQKLRHAPFRLFCMMHHLEQWNMLYEKQDTQAYPGTLTDGPDSENWLERLAENLLRHSVAGVEFSPVDNFFLRMGYNYQRRKELQVGSRLGMVGFSWGFGIKLSGFHLSYGRASYHLAGASNHFSLSTNLNELYSRSSR